MDESCLVRHRDDVVDSEGGGQWEWWMSFSLAVGVLLAREDSLFELQNDQSVGLGRLFEFGSIDDLAVDALEIRREKEIDFGQ